MAHTLGFAFGLLALYPDEQEKVLEQIKYVTVIVTTKGRVPPAVCSLNFLYFVLNFISIFWTYDKMPLFTSSIA